MTHPSQGPAGSGVPDRLYELMSLRAVEGLDASEQQELETLLRQHRGTDQYLFDDAAAAVWLSGLAVSSMESMPESVLLRAQSRIQRSIGAGALQGARALADVSGDGAMKIQLRRAKTVAVLGWLAAAAAVSIAAVGWLAYVNRATTSPAQLTVAQLRDRLVAGASDLRRASWTPTKDPLSVGAAGDVVWSDSSNEGYIRIRGLSANAAAGVRYQLWIFDEARTTPPHPISAGLFDVQAASGAGDEVIIALRPGLPIGKAKLFAVSAEPPGGSVLPTMERVLVTAQ